MRRGSARPTTMFHEDNNEKPQAILNLYGAISTRRNVLVFRGNKQ